jgi:hypothetical protein
MFIIKKFNNPGLKAGVFCFSRMKKTVLAISAFVAVVKIPPPPESLCSYFNNKPGNHRAFFSTKLI